MLLWIFLFVVLMLIIWKSSNRVLVGVKRIARAYGISNIAVTLIALSILASLPEFLVSGLAALRQSSEVSLGTVVGSNIFTLLVVLGVAALIRPFHVKMVIEERDGVWLLLSSAALLLVVPDGISRWEGMILVILYIPYLYSVYSAEKKKKSAHPVKAKPNRRLKMGKEILILVGATAIMLVSAEIVLRIGLKLAEMLDVPSLILGLILMGIGTSIPETAIGVISALKRQTDVTLGDVYGTNIFTCLFILGVCAIIHPIPVSSQVQSFLLPFFIFSTIILQLFFSTDHKVGRIEGAALILFYAYFALAALNILPKP